MTTALPVTRIMYNDEAISFGITEISAYKVLIDTRTGYINGTKVVANFLTRKNTPKRFDNWKAQNKEKIGLIFQEVNEKYPGECIYNNIMYQLNGSIDEGLPGDNESVLKMRFTTDTLTLDEINDNEYFDKSPKSMNIFIKGTYIHPLLCVNLIEWLNPENEPVHFEIINDHYKKLAFMKAVANNKLTNEQVVKGRKTIIDASNNTNAYANYLSIDQYVALQGRYYQKLQEVNAEISELYLTIADATATNLATEEENTDMNIDKRNYEEEHAFINKIIATKDYKLIPPAKQTEITKAASAYQTTQMKCRQLNSDVNVVMQINDDIIKKNNKLNADLHLITDTIASKKKIIDNCKVDLSDLNQEIKDQAFELKLIEAEARAEAKARAKAMKKAVK